MLQPSDAAAAASFNPPETNPRGSTPGNYHPDPLVQRKRGIWQWITFKEVVFVFLVCSSGALLFRSKDAVQFDTIWKEKIDTGHFANLRFPVEDEKMLVLKVERQLGVCTKH